MSEITVKWHIRGINGVKPRVVLPRLYPNSTNIAIFTVISNSLL